MTDEMAFGLRPLLMIELPGILPWTVDRVIAAWSFIERLQLWIDYESVEQAVRRFVEATIERIVRQSPSEEHRGLIHRIEERLVIDGRPNVYRVIDQLVENTILAKGRNIEDPVFDRRQAWEEFVSLEAQFVRHQIVMLWIDVLFYTRRHHPRWNEAVPLDDPLLRPTSSVLVTPEDKMLTMSEESTIERRFREVLCVQPNQSLVHEFNRLIVSACCILSGDLFNVLTQFSERVKHEIQRSGSLTLIELNGRQLVLKNRMDGGYAIASIVPAELRAWVSPETVSKSDQSAKVLAWQYVIGRLHEICAEQRRLDDLLEKPDDLEQRELALQSAARELIDLLCHVLEVSIDARDQIEIALRAMANVLPEYEDDWREDVLQQIFFEP